MSARDQMAKDAANAIMDAMNSMGVRPKDVADELARHHRTLQQTFTGVCIEWFKKLAEMEKDHDYDLRNEASCKLAKKVAHEFADVIGLPFI